MKVSNVHNIRCHEQFRVEKHVLKDLLETLKREFGLKEGRDIFLEKALVMFLITLGHGTLLGWCKRGINTHVRLSLGGLDNIGCCFYHG